MKSHIVLCLVFSLLLTGSLSAETVIFTGAINNLWSDPGNWNLGRLPGDKDQARFNAGASCVLDFAAPPIDQLRLRQPGPRLTLVDGAHLVCLDNAAISLNQATPEDPAVMEILGGVFDCHSNIRVSDDTPGLLVLDNDGVFNLHDLQFRVGHDDGGHGIAQLKGGSLNLLREVGDDGPDPSPLWFRNGLGAKAHVDFSGGVMRMAYSDERLAYINDHIADGTITAYYKFSANPFTSDFDIANAVGEVIVDTGDANDYIHVRGLHPFNPVPADGSEVASGPLTLEWTVDAGTVVDVWFSGDVGKIYAGNPDALLIAQQARTSVQVTAEKNTRYFWAVDTYAPGADKPNYGPVFSFMALANFPPEVSAGEDITTWLENGSVTVTLAGTVNEAADTTWTVISEPDDPNNPDAAIADPTALNTTITLCATGAYVLQLDANDGELDAEPSQMTINVYADSCLAAQSLPDYIPFPGDIDGDCDVDQDDLDLLMADWLKCNALSGCDPNVPNAP
jgi:hypothetical protein